MEAGSVQCCVTSPPYWPARRLYDFVEQVDGTIPRRLHPATIGFEPTWEEYLDHVVRRDFRELKRVLRPDGVVFVVIDDVIANPASIYDEQTYHSRRSKLNLQFADWSEDPGHHIPQRPKAIGWACRACLPWR